MRGAGFRPSALDDHPAARGHGRRNEVDLRWGSVFSYFLRNLSAPQREFPTKKLTRGMSALYQGPSSCGMAVSVSVLVVGWLAVCSRGRGRPEAGYFDA